MKKRIISLILVVATLFLTLTGCAYSYAKDDMTKYATFDKAAFTAALQALVIEDGTFGTDEEGRKTQVEETIATALLSLATDNDKNYSGAVSKYDKLYFYYYATDASGNIFYADKMGTTGTSISNVQLGLSTLDGLNKAISDAILAITGDLDASFILTTLTNRIGDKDVVSVSYRKTYKEGEAIKVAEVADNKYVTVSQDDAFLKNLIGAYVGKTLDGTFTVTEGEGDEAKEYIYTDVVVESIAKDNSTDTVPANSTIYLSYTKEFEWDEDTLGTPKDLQGNELHGSVATDGKFKVSVTYGKETVGEADAADAEDDAKTFHGQIVGKDAATTINSAINVKEKYLDKDGNEVTVDVKYSSVKTHFVVENDPTAIEVKYTPYTTALNDDSSNKTQQANIYGEKITLNEVELTYHIFPLYTVEAGEITAEKIIENYYSVLTKKEVPEHEHEDDEDESLHDEVYIFDVMADSEYKNGDKTFEALVNELVELETTQATNDKAVTTALTALKTAQQNLAKDTGSSASETANLKTKLTDAEKKYADAVKTADESQAKVDEKAAEILACKKGETSVEDTLVEEYKEYQYDLLEDAYKETLRENLAKAIFAAAEEALEYTGTLPKKAVKDAYNAIMNTYKYNFYEGTYSSGTSSSTSTSTETNYSHYKGDFDSYVLAQTSTDSMEKAEAAIELDARKTVQEIILIYVLVDAVGEDEVALTKEEKKNIKENMETYALLYQQYGIAFSYNLDDYIHAQQFDKVFDHLLEEDTSAEGNVVEYKNIKYSIKADEEQA